MNFRISKLEDFEYMAQHSTNKTERKRIDRVDYDYTLEHEGRVLGMGGFSMILPETYWCWIDLTPEAEDHILTTYRVTKEWINQFADKMEIKRLQAFVRNDERHIRLVNHLGFQREFLMKNFYANEDAYMYRKLF